MSDEMGFFKPLNNNEEEESSPINKNFIESMLFKEEEINVVQGGKKGTIFVCAEGGIGGWVWLGSATGNDRGGDQCCCVCDVLSVCDENSSATSMEIQTRMNTFHLIFFSLLFYLLTSQACHPIDHHALLDFKHKITSDPSNLLESWKPQTDCCRSWDGIACDSAGRVINVSRSGLISGKDSMVDTSMSGTLSPSLSNLTFLQLLELSQLKDLTGRIPPEFGKLSRLTHLYLHSNKLSGSVPDTFRLLFRLEELYLSNNHFSGGIPPEIFRCFRSLTEIGLSGNQFSGKIPSSIGEMVSITRLDFHENNFSGVIPATIGKLKKLSDLDLSENQITGALPESLGSLRNLEILYLNKNQLSGSIPFSIGGLASVQFIRLSENKLTGAIPPSIGELPKIERFTGNIPSSFGNLRNLQTLDLSRNMLSGPITSQLAKLQELQALDLSFNPLKLYRLPNWFSKLKLSRLKMANTGIQGPFPGFLSSASTIWELDLSSNSLTDKLPHWIGNMTNLMTLNLSNNRFTNAIPAEFKNLSVLMDLDLHSNNFSGDINTIFKKIAGAALGNFNSIDVSYNSFSGPINNGDESAMDLVVSLVLSHNPIGGMIPEWLSRRTQLERILISNSKLIGNIPEELLDLKNLKDFDVSENRLIGEIPGHKTSIPASAFSGNPGLCGTPLPPCKHSFG
ncbi:hypothetical protein LXL04_024632 [Taraxacum kok-saghyz]